MESTENSQLPLIVQSNSSCGTVSSLARWDLTKNLHMNFQSATHAQIEEPYTPVNKDLYPDQYHAWKDSVWTSIKHLGTPLDYNQTFTASYQLPLNLIPIFDWANAHASLQFHLFLEQGYGGRGRCSVWKYHQHQSQFKPQWYVQSGETLQSCTLPQEAANQKLDKEPSRSQIQKKKQEKARGKTGGSEAQTGIG